MAFYDDAIVLEEIQNLPDLEIFVDSEIQPDNFNDSLLSETRGSSAPEQTNGSQTPGAGRFKRHLHAGLGGDLSENRDFGDHHKRHATTGGVSCVQEALHFLAVSTPRNKGSQTPGRSSIVGEISSSPISGPSFGPPVKKRCVEFIQQRRMDEESSDSEADAPQDPNATAKQGPPSRRYFACPFFKKSPETYMSHRGCPGPGWVSIHRLKGHLYRKHRLPQFRCNRCGQDLEDAPGLVDHQRSDPPCTLQPAGSEEGIDANQESQLKSRKRKQTGKVGHEKWSDIYRILFPNIEPSLIPSPYYDYAPDDGLNEAQSQSVSRCCNRTLNTYARYLETELPPHIEGVLERDVGLDLHTPNRVFRDRISSAVRSSQLDILSRFLNNPALHETLRGEDARMPTWRTEPGGTGGALKVDKPSVLDEIQPQAPGFWDTGAHIPSSQLPGWPWEPMGVLDDIFKGGGEGHSQLSGQENLPPSVPGKGDFEDAV
ncbi:hypothetical protein SAMD00023353_5300750 [Rosellinia necatrix]|uniref:C2H2-type domain-containing protein n=1 Tax=Rosellinia necatrix TaxID=77044 RepID=A0A1W2TRQ5_ROSNE|nr:hypothetical protein SAMD00023353_5300750 [Rosellinia necatrix]